MSSKKSVRANVEAEVLKEIKKKPCVVIQTDGFAVLDAFSSTDLTVFVVDYNPRLLHRSKEREIQLGETRAYLWGKNIAANETTQHQESLIDTLFSVIASKNGRYKQIFRASEISDDFGIDSEFTNAEHAECAIEALASSTHRATLLSGDHETAIMDLVIDLMHLCDRKKLDFYELLFRAENHYRAELEEDKIMRRRQKRAVSKAKEKPKKN